MRYFDLFDDMLVPKRWELDTPRDEQGQEINVDSLILGRPLSIKNPLRVPICRLGRPLEFSFLVSGPVPVVTERLAEVFTRLAPEDVELFPATVDGQSGLYYVVSVRKVVKCIDDELSEEVLHWLPEDGRPEKIGQYQNVAGMRVDPSRIGDAKIFRPWGWRVVLVVSEEIKNAMERVGALGAKFVQV